LSEIVARLIHRKEAVVITRKHQPVAALVPFEEWAKKESSDRQGLASAAGVLSDYDSEIDEMIEVVSTARAKAKDRKAAI
jgi:antitoxin (DNA-binding transcriptional repressor) of toxin-antitoxin stability system